jgi:hypothetical protein
VSVSILTSLGQIAGLGGIALGTVMLLYRDVLRRRLLTRLSANHSFQILMLIIVLAWGIGVVGIAGWLAAPTSTGPARSVSREKCNPTIRDNSGSVTQTFNCQEGQ